MRIVPKKPNKQVAPGQECIDLNKPSGHPLVHKFSGSRASIPTLNS
jgi:hypothetical protein